MQIGRDAVVAFEYTLKNDAGDIVDESGNEPLTYIHGHGQIVPGLEAALEGKGAGAAVQVTIAPQDGYGEKTSNKSVRISADELPPDADLEIGMALEASDPDGKPITLWVISKDKDGINVSLDHPLAGQTLHFDVQVKDVRKATQDELDHGHVHGPHGHHH